MTEFTPTQRSRVKRYHERGHYDKATVCAILDAAFLCHIAYTIDDQPYCTPTAYWRDGDTLYWHGSSASRMLREHSKGIPVCLTVTHMDGLVLARSGFHCSINYRSVMAFGVAHKVEDDAHKQRALDHYVERLFPGRVAEMRAVTAQELKATTVMSMLIEEASAKMRAAPPGDDEEDYAADIWAGVIPVTQVVGELEDCPRLKPTVSAGTSVADYTVGERLDNVLAKLHTNNS